MKYISSLGLSLIHIFTDLVWKDPEGRELLTVPDGKIRVNMWDVITRNFKASAINGIELNDATIVVDLDDNNRLDLSLIHIW